MNWIICASEPYTGDKILKAIDRVGAEQVADIDQEMQRRLQGSGQIVLTALLVDPETRNISSIWSADDPRIIDKRICHRTLTD